VNACRRISAPHTCILGYSHLFQPTSTRGYAYQTHSFRYIDTLKLRGYPFLISSTALYGTQSEANRGSRLTLEMHSCTIKSQTTRKEFCTFRLDEGRTLLVFLIWKSYSCPISHAYMVLSFMAPPRLASLWLERLVKSSCESATYFSQDPSFEDSARFLHGPPSEHCTAAYMLTCPL
jgi:hypothetical protein